MPTSNVLAGTANSAGNPNARPHHNTSSSIDSTSTAADTSSHGVPLSNNSVFVSTDVATMTNGSAVPTPQKASTPSRARTPLSINTASASGSTPTNAAGIASPTSGRTSTSTSRSTPRRSRKHQPKLLMGFDDGEDDDEDDGVGASEAVLLTGLGIHAVKTKRPSLAGRRSSTRASSSSKKPSRLSPDHDHFRIEDGLYDETPNDGGRGSIDYFDEQRHSDGKRYATPSSGGTPHADAPYATHLDPFQDGQDDNVLYGDDEEDEMGDEDDDPDDLEAQHDGRRSHAPPFEPITKREQTWMWTSVVFVIALSIVSIAIAVDWIDWPGDGIGKD